MKIICFNNVPRGTHVKTFSTIAVLLATLIFFIPTLAGETIKVPIILYHNVTTNTNLENNPSLNITPDQLKSHLQTLNKNGYNTISFYDYYNYIYFKQELPENPIIITFDDGYLSNYKYAYPMLKQLGMKATIFMVTGRAGSTQTDEVTYPHFTWAQAIEMENSGVIDIESHSDLHLNFSEQYEINDFNTELRRSRYLIEKNLDKDCLVFAFPYGGKSDLSRQLAAKAGYKMLCIVGDEGVNTSADSLLSLKRLTIRGDLNADALINLIEYNKNLV